MSMLSFEQALAELLRGTVRLVDERVVLDDADGRVLARPLVAPTDLPAQDYSAMDGYALHTDSVRGEAPWRLPVRGESRTGRTCEPLGPSGACRIFTGAPLPSGANAVVLQEDVERDGDCIVTTNPVRSGQFIRRRGDDLHAGCEAIAAGTRLGPGRLALAASVDAAHVWVSRRPVVAIVSTGDELRHAGEPARAASIPESASVAIAAMARRAAAVVRTAPFAPDDPDQTARILSDASRAADLLVTIGGASVGDYDVVRPALERCGIRIDFWRVAIKPGKPIAVGTGPSGLRVIGLPGNPTSAQVSFALFGMPLLRTMQGDTHPIPERFRAQLLESTVREPGRLEFMRGQLEMHESRLGVRALRNQASGATTAMA